MTPGPYTLLEQHFDTAFAAPDGIKKLRELILTLAMQGKLVPQDPNDQPASELLKDIEAERRRLVKVGEIKEHKPLQEIKAEETPFEIPNGWEWVRLGELTSKIGSGSTPRGGSNAYVREGIPFLRSQNVWNEGLKLGTVAYITSETHENMANTKVFPQDILLNITGASLGRCTLVPDSFDEANVSQHVTIIRSINSATRHYLHSLILSPYCQNLIWTRQVGMAREGLSKKVLELFEIPLPPLAEQHRIVARIDELMARCDELERLREKQQQKRVSVHTAALNNLLTATDTKDFNKAWSFITQHFNDLYAAKENLTELRKTILQLAVMGKLVPQDPNDQPASELLREIEAEKKRLVKAGENKLTLRLQEIPKEEFPFNVPKEWARVRLGDISVIERGGSPRPIKSYLTDDPNGHNWIKIGDTEKDGKYITHTKEKIREEGLSKTRRVYPGDFLLTNSMSFGRPYITKIEGCIHDGWLRIRPPEVLEKDYLFYLLTSPIVIALFKDSASGAVVLNLNADKVRELAIPIPPLAEQHRIVAKVDQLMTMCDALEQHIDAATKQQTALLNAVMSQI